MKHAARFEDKEWYVAAAVFTLHVLLATIFLLIWAVLGLFVFLGIAWLVALW